jgi:hypothetical protein
MESHCVNLKKIRSGPVATGLSWSPDGLAVSFLWQPKRQAEKAGKEIYVIDCNGLNERKIPREPLAQRSSGGTEIMFVGLGGWVTLRPLER